jgi:IS1 family transposase
MKLFEFMRIYGDNTNIVSTLRSIGLLNGRLACDKCGGRMSDTQHSNTDGLRVRCSKRACRTVKTIRAESFFSNAKLSLTDAMLFLHLWSKGYPERLIEADFAFSKTTIVDWSRYCRDLCVYDLENSDAVIGGPGCIVEIDETLAVKRKNDQGRMLRAGWLFGGIERRNDDVFNCFIHMVYNRNEALLTHLIRTHIRPGTHIMTDGWAAYRNLSTMGYIHSVVVHETNFVSPENNEVHTQRIESTWSSLKRFIRSRGTNKGEYYLEYIAEYLFRRRHETVFDSLLDAIRAKYPFNQ